jgi:dipeptidyl aminopeptidase/acylaminoacyl peptidase
VIYPCSHSRCRWLRRFRLLICVFLACCSLPAARAEERGESAQNIGLDKPLQTIDEEITAFAFAPDGRIVYSVRRLFKTKKYDLQRDDIWLQEANGKRRRLLIGEKFVRGTAPFTYTVDSFRWSPNGRLILAQLFTTSVDDDSGKTQDAVMTLVLDDSGREIRINGGDNVLADAAHATCLGDNTTIVYLTEAVKPHVLYSIQSVRPAAGPAAPLFAGRTFVDADWLAVKSLGIAVERDRALGGPPRIQRLDLMTQDDKEIATLDAYAGGISVSPSGKMVAYFIDREVLEIRDLTSPNRIARLRIGFGAFQWAPDETRILLKRAPEKKSGDLQWIDVPALAQPQGGQDIAVIQPTPQPIFHGLSFRDFAISPDGRYLAVVEVGKRSLLVFPLPPR